MKDLVFALMTPVGNYKEKQALGTNHTPLQLPSPDSLIAYLPATFQSVLSSEYEG